MIDLLSRQLINTYQGGFPLVKNPFEVVAHQLKTDEKSVIEKISELLNSGMLSRFGPLYDATKLGGAFSLSAMQVPKEKFEDVSEALNNIPQIAHNYRREHKLNMWFVIACDKPEGIESTIELIEKTTRLKVFDFPKLQEFYIGLWLNIDDKGKVSTRSISFDKKEVSYKADEQDKQIIKATQSGLPLVSDPYRDIATTLSITENVVLERLKLMLDSGMIRRVGLVPNHYKLGLKANGMSVWNVPDSKVKELGEKIGALDFVSHSYERPRHLPLWNYNLFAMVHGENKDEVHEKVALIAEILGDSCAEYDVLFSSKILKKTGMRLVA
jgi:DNA-binding Lrp family transcriptional regulator